MDGVHILEPAKPFAHDRFAETFALVRGGCSDRFEISVPGDVVVPNGAEGRQFPFGRNNYKIKIAPVHRTALHVIIPIPTPVVFVWLIRVEYAPGKLAPGRVFRHVSK